ncbi:MAG: thioredoxin family protein [candidate division KSB1 bacterium]|nr:thioredoxin family protein [candidate division KSB1 bacterium]MDZ7386632.1 thioredoxin family protein [candidate division KSB1 bacterium]MDZ7394193.1 thioredoxin family protein [candidate division KSB1 bacterium]MDZ7414096.1 thioredoxin family protein [candidate division KSB1 bacterium]
MKEEAMAEKVFIEVLTLDSRACSPCQYMVEAVKRVVVHYPGRIEWRETLIKTREGMERVRKLGVSKLPSLLINGVPEFVSIIPSEHELRAAIERQLGPR